MNQYLSNLRSRAGLTASTLLFAVGTLASPVVFADRIIAMNDGPSDFYEIFPDGPGASLLGNGVQDTSLSGLAYDSTNGKMYVSDVCGPECYGIGEVNLETWEITQIGLFTNTSNIHALAHDPMTDTLIGWDTESYRMVTIDRATSLETYIGVTDVAEVRAMAYDPISDTMYGADFLPEDSQLVIINRNTGAVTPVGPFVVDIESSVGMAFDSATGSLYIADDDGDFFEVNTSTGEATLLGNLGIPFDAMTSIPDGRQPPTHPVPGLSFWSILALAGLLLSLGIVSARRRA